MLTNLPYATLEWELGRISGDGPDGDLHPDYASLVGEAVKIVPSIQGPLVYVGPAGKKTTVFLNPVDAIVGAGGAMHAVGDPTRKIRVLATDDTNLSATGWIWTATIASPSVVAKFAAPAGTTVDISDFLLAPPNSATHSWVAQIPQLVELLTGTTVSIEQVEAIIEQWFDDNPVEAITSWSTIPDKPPVIASGLTELQARQAISAMAADWTPAANDIPNLPISRITNLQSSLDDKATVEALNTRLRIDNAQGLTGPQQTQGRANLGAVSMADVEEAMEGLAPTIMRTSGTVRPTDDPGVWVIFTGADPGTNAFPGDSWDRTA